MAVSLAGWNCGGDKGEDGPYVCNPPIPERPVAADGDNTFPVGPAMMHVTESSAAVMWETETECDGELRFGVSGQALDGTVTSERQGTVHKAFLSGLEPDTQYDYSVSACSLSTAVLSFWTAPQKGSPVRFTVWGDSRTHPERSIQVVDAMVEQNPHFTLHTGDTVTHGEIRPEWQDE
jgi:phosphodiesterase/alkaline phosphatase D-like protein